MFSLQLGSERVICLRWVYYSLTVGNKKEEQKLARCAGQRREHPRRRADGPLSPFGVWERGPLTLPRACCFVPF